MAESLTFTLPKCYTIKNEYFNIELILQSKHVTLQPENNNKKMEINKFNTRKNYGIQIESNLKCYGIQKQEEE